MGDGRVGVGNGGEIDRGINGGGGWMMNLRMCGKWKVGRGRGEGSRWYGIGGGKGKEGDGMGRGWGWGRGEGYVGRVARGGMGYAEGEIAI